MYTRTGSAGAANPDMVNYMKMAFPRNQPKEFLWSFRCQWLLLFDLNITHSVKWLKFATSHYHSSRKIPSLSIHYLAERLHQQAPKWKSLQTCSSMFFSKPLREKSTVVQTHRHNHYPSVAHSAGSSQTPSGNPGARRSQRGWTHQKSCCHRHHRRRHLHRTGMAETRRLHHQASASPSLQWEIVRERNEKSWLVSQYRPNFAVLWSLVLQGC